MRNPIPKSQRVIKETSGGELKYRASGKPFAGIYMETTKGKFYAGSDNISPGAQLIPVKPPSNKAISKSKDILKFNVIKPLIKNFLNNTEPIPSNKSYPLEDDYLQGHFIRYFSKRINGSDYQEIEKEVYESMIKKETTYDYNLYEVGKIKWYITGNVFKENALSLEHTERKFRNISYLFPILNEYSRADLPVQEGLYTEGGELYNSDGTDYIGSYHIHPTMGPMEGDTHTDTPHSKLYYLNQLPSPQDMDYEDLLKTYPPPGVPPELPTINPDRGAGIISPSFNCVAIWGVPPPGYTGYINSSGQAPLTTDCLDPEDGTGLYKFTELGATAINACFDNCDGTAETFGIGCLWDFDPNYCEGCSLHYTESCTGNYIHNVDSWEPSYEGDYICFCGNFDGLPYYSDNCC